MEIERRVELGYDDNSRLVNINDGSRWRHYIDPQLNFEIWAPVLSYNSEIKRQRSTGYNPYINPIRLKEYSHHEYNTRFSKKYNEKVIIRLYKLNLEVLQEIMYLIIESYSDLNIYLERSLPDPRLYTYYDNEDGYVELEGNVMSIARLIITNEFGRVVENTYDYYTRPLEDVKIRLSYNQYNSMIKRSICKDNNAEVCSICLNDIKRNQKISTTTCNHTYHTNCLKKWLMLECTRPECPQCRRDQRPDNEKDDVLYPNTRAHDREEALY